MRLAYRLDGPEDAPVVVLSNALGTTLEMWRPQVRALAVTRRLLRYDHRGHGRSEVPPGPYAIADLGADLLELLDRLGIERCSFAGISLGGVIGMWLAAAAAERIDRLALVSTVTRFGSRDGWIQRAAEVRAQGMAGTAAAAIERWFTPALRAREPALVERFRLMLEQTPPEGYAGCCEALAECDFAGRLGAIRAPTLVVAAEFDATAPPDQARSMAAAIQRSRLVVIEGAAHMANVDRPEVVTAALVEHLTGPLTA